MAILSTILNLVLCGLTASLGTGLKGCKPFFKKVTAIWLTPQGFKYDGTVALTESYINQLKAEGNLIVLKGIRTFTDNTEDDVKETLDDGIKQVTRLGLYEFAIMFINGLYFHAALHSINSQANYDATFIDRDGNILGTLAADGSLKGFTLGMFQAKGLDFATDTTGQKEGAEIQLTERVELDTSYVFIQRESLTFNPNLITGVNEIVLSFASAPADAEEAVNVKAVRKQDGAAFTGVDYLLFTLSVDGVTGNPSAGDDSVLEGTYVLTVSALSEDEVLALSLFDNAQNRDGVVVGDDTYKSNTITAVVTA
jgi:hypothetical protein